MSPNCNRRATAPQRRFSSTQKGLDVVTVDIDGVTRVWESGPELFHGAVVSRLPGSPADLVRHWRGAIHHDEVDFALSTPIVHPLVPLPQLVEDDSF